LTFGLGVLLPLLRLLPPPALALSRLPAVQLAEAFRLLAVALIPRPRRKRTPTARPVTSPRRKPRGARRTRGRGSMLFASHGRWCSRPGYRDRGFSILPTPWFGLRQEGVPHLRQPVTPLSTTRPTGRRVRCAGVPSRKDEGNREGDGLELARLLKETISSKETTEGRKQPRKQRRRGRRRRRTSQPSD